LKREVTRPIPHCHSARSGILRYAVPISSFDCGESRGKLCNFVRGLLRSNAEFLLGYRGFEFRVTYGLLVSANLYAVTSYLPSVSPRQLAKATFVWFYSVM
jgi:hypothetical protein